MTVNELAAAAENAAERYAVARDTGSSALSTLAAVRKGLADAEQARDASLAALDALADRQVAGTQAGDKAVSVALLAVESAARGVVWAEAIVAAGQRALATAQSSLAEAEADRMAAAEQSRRASLRARVEQLAYGQAAA